MLLTGLIAANGVIVGTIRTHIWPDYDDVGWYVGMVCTRWMPFAHLL